MDKELLTKLENLKREDIKTRNKLLEENRLYGTYDEMMQDIHIKNAQALDELISIHSWPGISKVGLEGSRIAWLIAQHANCTPDLQRKFFTYLSKAADDGDAPKKQAALLGDRIRFNEGKPQIYGTVFDWDANGELSCKVEDPEKLDDLRASVGLSPFLQALEEEKTHIKKEGGSAPSDLKAYKQAQLEWAKRVGWV